VSGAIPSGLTQINVEIPALRPNGRMVSLVTLTMNPSIDISTTVDKVIPSRKLRCGPSRRDPGGGGVNVARVARRLGADVIALHTSGGERGQLLSRLLRQEDIPAVAIPIDDDTREDFTVEEQASGNEYRFVSSGPQLSEREWRAALTAISTLEAREDFLVASGSLPPGAPDDFYRRAADIARERGMAFALDASGAALKATLGVRVEVLKPSLREMRELTGEALVDPAAILRACRDLVERANVAQVALTLGSQGAVFVTREGAWRAWPLPIKAVSTVGAGDSFLAALVCALAQGRSAPEAFARGVAGGSAALLANGTQLCRPGDVDALTPQVQIDRVS